MHDFFWRRVLQEQWAKVKLCQDIVEEVWGKQA